MATTMTPAAQAAISTLKDRFLDAYEREHATTMRVLRAFPADKIDMRPHPKSKTAGELAWVFVAERGLGTMLMNNAFASGMPAGEAPKAPREWDAILAGIEQAHRDFGDMMRAMPDEKLTETVRFFVAPKTMGDIPRIDVAWFLLHDEIHHRGQFSVYLRMADAKVPSIYGPTLDEPWM